MFGCASQGGPKIKLNPEANVSRDDVDKLYVVDCLLPGQVIKEHSAPSSPVHIIVLEGKGLFSGGEGGFREFGPKTCIKFEQGEKHSIKATDEKLVFIALLRGSPRKEND